jgi:hypothetical protein
MKQCKNCNSLFETNGKKVHCSIECRTQFFRKIEKEKKQQESRELKDEFEGTCNYCNAKFKSYFHSGTRKKFCSLNCKDEFHKAKKREANDLKHELCDKKCDHCDKMFKPRRHINERFCRKQCHTNYHANQEKIKRADIRASTIRECPICNISFTPKKSLKEMYCSAKCRTSLGKKIYKMMSSVYSSCGTVKETNSHHILGYSAEELLNHLRTFPQWERLKTDIWHLDHIFPIKAFVDKKISNISLICSLDNLQPLSGATNCKKSSKYDEKKFNEWLVSKGVVGV